MSRVICYALAFEQFSASSPFAGRWQFTVTPVVDARALSAPSLVGEYAYATRDECMRAARRNPYIKRKGSAVVQVARRVVV